MLGDLSRVEKIYLRTGYTDMRKQLDGLVDIIQYSFQLDPHISTPLSPFCLQWFFRQQTFQPGKRLFEGIRKNRNYLVESLQ